jgi:molybdopterin converting factor small subunit
MVTVLLFGMIKDIVGNNTLMLHEVNDTDELIDKLHSVYPRLTDSEYVIAVDRNIIQENTKLQQNAEVALLPPFSGG